MSQTVAPPIPSLVPETAPFSPEQRAWLNGFFAGLVSLDGAGVTALSPEQSAALMPGAAGLLVQKLGLDNEMLGEVLAVVGLFNQMNKLADAYQIEPDILPKVQ